MPPEVLEAWEADERTRRRLAEAEDQEIRHARTSAATILARLAPARSQKFTERSRRAARVRHSAAE